MCTLRPHAYVLRSPLCTLTARVLKLIQYILLNSCWLSIKNGAIWAFIAPALLVIFVSLFIFFLSFHLTSPHLTSPHLTSPHLTLPHLTSPHLTSPHLTLPHLTLPYLTYLPLTDMPPRSETVGIVSCMNGFRNVNNSFYHFVSLYSFSIFCIRV